MMKRLSLLSLIVCLAIAGCTTPTNETATPSQTGESPQMEKTESAPLNPDEIFAVNLRQTQQHGKVQVELVRVLVGRQGAITPKYPELKDRDTDALSAQSFAEALVGNSLPSPVADTPTKSPAEALIGKWKVDDPHGVTIEFTKDERFIVYLSVSRFNAPPELIPMPGGKYSLLDDHTGTITYPPMYPAPLGGKTRSFTFSIQGDKLTLIYSNGSTVTYTRIP